MSATRKQTTDTARGRPTTRRFFFCAAKRVAIEPGQAQAIRAASVACLALALLGVGDNAQASAEATGDPKKGAYLTAAAGCVSCHTDADNNGIPFAGGHRLETPYGVFVAPNITPDTETGIGGWTDAAFLAAMRTGTSPAGDAYYPSFPYASYAGMQEQDVYDIKAYLDSLEPVSQANPGHELDWYVPGRWAMSIWQWLFAPWEYPNGEAGAEWQRGAYLVRHLGHCGECHTPRNLFGALEVTREMAGSPKDASGRSAPNLTRDKEQGIGQWNRNDIEFFLELGMKPDGDFAGGTMTPVIDDNTAKLSTEDRRAITTYLLSLKE